MASPYEVQLMTDLRDTTLRLLQTAGTTPAQDPSAWQFVNQATNWLLNPEVDAEGSTPAFGYVVSGVHYMVDFRRKVWRFDMPLKKYVLAFP